jgi:large-conductance mechanosensitive channel
MRCMVVIDLLIVGFACISLIAFATTKDTKKHKKNVETESVQKENETPD